VSKRNKKPVLRDAWVLFFKAVKMAKKYGVKN